MLDFQKGKLADRLGALAASSRASDRRKFSALRKTMAAAGACGLLQQRVDPELPVERSASYQIYRQQ